MVSIKLYVHFIITNHLFCVWGSYMCTNYLQISAKGITYNSEYLTCPGIHLWWSFAVKR